MLEFGEISNMISRGSDLLIFFFVRSISLLTNYGTGILIVQNGWLNTEYGEKASKFFLKTLKQIKIIDSSFKFFDESSANINTVITFFRKNSFEETISFNMMEKNNKNNVYVKKKKSFNINNAILFKDKWGYIMNTKNEIFDLFSNIIYNKNLQSQSFYTIGQGINERKEVFIPKKYLNQIKQNKNLINAIFKESMYYYKNTDYFLYHSFTANKEDISFLKTIGAEEFAKGKSIKRKYPSIIMPRGIGETHFAGILPDKTLSNSYVDVYINSSNDDDLYNIWLFCNSTLFFLYRELSGRRNLGGGLLKAEASDIKNIPLYFPISDRKKIKSIINKCDKPINLINRIESEIQSEIDLLVLKYFNIEDKYNLIISELKRLFEFRVKKAKS